MFKLFFLFLVAAGWALAASALHVVRTPANILTFTVLPKNTLTFTDTYVDARAWTARDLELHAPLVRRVISSGNVDTLAHLTDPKSSRDAATQLSDAVARVPAPGTSSPIPNSASLHAAISQLKAGKIRPDDLAKVLATAHD